MSFERAWAVQEQIERKIEKYLKSKKSMEPDRLILFVLFLILPMPLIQIIDFYSRFIPYLKGNFQIFVYVGLIIYLVGFLIFMHNRRKR